jgi:hypothetical protein
VVFQFSFLFSNFRWFIEKPVISCKLLVQNGNQKTAL